MKEYEEAPKDMAVISKQLFEYIAVNEGTFNCICIAKDQVACFYNLNNKLKSFV